MHADAAQRPPWIVPALWATCLLAALRVAILDVLLVHTRGMDFQGAQWVVADGTPRILLNAWIAGLIATLPLAGPEGPQRARLALRRRALAFAVVAMMLLGLPAEPAGLRIAPPDLGPVPGPLLLVVLAAPVAVFLRGWVERRAPREFAPAVIALLVVAVGSELIDRRAAPTREVVVLEDELLGSAILPMDRITEVAEGAIRTEVLFPSLHPVEGAPFGHKDRPALVMSPPAEVRFDVADQEGLRLHTGAGVCWTTLQRLRGDAPDLAVRFEVLVDDEVRFEEVLHAHWDRYQDQRYWHEAGGSDGIELPPGATVTLRTSWAGDPHPLGAEHLRVGFSDLQITRTYERPAQRATRAQPNIVFIVVDTLRADRMGCYGYGRNTTPWIDALAAQGTRFEEAFATSSWTWPSTASLLTGLAPEAHGVTSNESCFLAGKLTTLAEELQAEGYATGAFSCNPLIVRGKNFHQGFDHFEGDSSDFRRSTVVMPGILDWIDGHASERFFLYLHLADPHTPHVPLPAQAERMDLGPDPEGLPRVDRGDGVLVDPLDLYAGQLNQPANYDADGRLRDAVRPPQEHLDWISDSYDACVATADHHVGHILSRIANLGLNGETVIVITSDHGEELFEHGQMAHGHSVHRELVHVPLILAGPGVPVGLEVIEPVSNRHLVGTLARMGGARPKAEEPGPGAYPTMDLLTAGERLGEAVSFATEKAFWNGHKGQIVQGLREGDRVFHWALTGAGWGETPGPGGDVRLYDARRDPGELRDLAGERPASLDPMRERIVERIEASAEIRAGLVTHGAGGSTASLLEIIGYFERNEANGEPGDNSEGDSEDQGGG